MTVKYTINNDALDVAAVVSRIRREAMMDADIVVRELLSLLADVERAGRMGSCPWCGENGGSEFAETVDHDTTCPVFGEIGVMSNYSPDQEPRSPRTREAGPVTDSGRGQGGK